MNEVDRTRDAAGRPAPVSTTAIGALNQNTILDAVRTHSELSKSKIAEHTGLSMPTVSRALKTLSDTGYVEQAGVEASQGGRPPVTVRVVPRAVVVGAVQAQAGRVIGALVGFDGTIFERIERSVPFSGKTPGLATLRSVIDETIALAAPFGAAFRGVGVSIAGITTGSGSLISGLDARRWTGMTTEQITRGYDVPVLVENDANLLAIGELYRGVGRDTDHFVTLVLDRGLGSGIVVNGALYRGARSAAGEVGYLLLGADSLTRSPAAHGELEAVLEPTVVTEQARQAGVDLGRELTAPEVIALAADGNAALGVLADVVLDGLARGIAALTSILDPTTIVLGAGLNLRPDAVVPAIERRLAGRIHAIPEIRTATLGADAVLLGAAEMVLRSTGTLDP